LVNIVNNRLLIITHNHGAIITKARLICNPSDRTEHRTLQRRDTTGHRLVSDGPPQTIISLVAVRVIAG
jgi:hypothetical protein